MAKINLRDSKQIIAWYLDEKRRVMSNPYITLPNWKDHNDLVEGFLKSSIESHVKLVIQEIIEERRGDD